MSVKFADGSFAGRRSGFVLSAKDSLFDVGSDCAELMAESVAREHICLPLCREGDLLHVACADSNNVMLQDKLRFLLNCNVRAWRRPKSEIEEAINILYGYVHGESADSILMEFTDQAADYTLSQPEPEDKTRSLGLIEEFTLQPEEVEPFRTSKRRKHELMQSGYGRSKNRSKGDGMFLYTVQEGDKALAFRNNGSIDVIEGPARVWKGSNHFRRMDHLVAHPGEFLQVRFCDGSQEHIKGPSEIWLDPRIHSGIEVREGLSLATKEAVVVYGENKNGVTNRRIVHGPCMFVPMPGEWLHKFSWHASRGGSNGVEKKPNGLKFQKLWLMPDQMYHDVRDVRTADDAVLIIRLMIFFELLDIEKMLDTTHDPIGDFINAATSDVVEFTGKRDFESFKQQTEQLNDLGTYTQLLHRAAQCGYRINNVVYRGYGAPESLQKMHDEAIAARTSLQLNTETEKQSQELEDYRLQCQMERAQRRRLEQATEVEHDIELQRKRSDAELSAKRELVEFKRSQARQDAELQQEMARQKDQQLQQHLHELREMGVELTEYLTQGRADQVIEVRGGGNQQPHLHLTDQRSNNGNGKRVKSK